MPCSLFCLSNASHCCRAPLIYPIVTKLVTVDSFVHMNSLSLMEFLNFPCWFWCVWLLPEHAATLTNQDLTSYETDTSFFFGDQHLSDFKTAQPIFSVHLFMPFKFTCGISHQLNCSVEAGVFISFPSSMTRRDECLHKCRLQMFRSQAFYAMPHNTSAEHGPHCFATMELWLLL